MISFIKFIFVINIDKISKWNFLKKILMKIFGGFVFIIILVIFFLIRVLFIFVYYFSLVKIILLKRRK